MSSFSPSRMVSSPLMSSDFKLSTVPPPCFLPHVLDIWFSDVFIDVRRRVPVPDCSLVRFFPILMLLNAEIRVSVVVWTISSQVFQGSVFVVSGRVVGGCSSVISLAVIFLSSLICR